MAEELPVETRHMQEFANAELQRQIPIYSQALYYQYECIIADLTETGASLALMTESILKGKSNEPRDFLNDPEADPETVALIQERQASLDSFPIYPESQRDNQVNNSKLLASYDAQRTTSDNFITMEPTTCQVDPGIEKRLALVMNLFNGLAQINTHAQEILKSQPGGDETYVGLVDKLSIVRSYLRDIIEQGQASD